MDKNFNPNHMTKEELEAIADSVYPGIALFARDVNLPPVLAQRYTKGLVIREKAFTTKEPSRPINKAITLRKEWELTSENKHVTLEYKDHQTLLHVRCQHGIPVEFTLRLIKSRTSSLMEE